MFGLIDQPNSKKIRTCQHTCFWG